MNDYMENILENIDAYDDPYTDEEISAMLKEAEGMVSDADDSMDDIYSMDYLLPSIEDYEKVYYELEYYLEVGRFEDENEDSV